MICRENERQTRENRSDVLSSLNHRAMFHIVVSYINIGKSLNIITIIKYLDRISIVTRCYTAVIALIKIRRLLIIIDNREDS